MKKSRCEIAIANVNGGVRDHYSLLIQDGNLQKKKTSALST